MEYWKNNRNNSTNDAYSIARTLDAGAAAARGMDCTGPGEDKLCPPGACPSMSPDDDGDAAEAVSCLVTYVAFRVESGDGLGVCCLTVCAEIGVDSYDSG